MDRYEKALERAKSFIGRWQGIEIDSELALKEFKDIFPELRESEDERIRKTLIHIVKGACDKYGIKYRGEEISEEKLLAYLEKQKEQKPAHTAKEMWKEMRLEVYAQASGNRHEPNYSDDSTKMFSLCDIDEIFEKIGNSTIGSQPAEWSEEDEKIRQSLINDLEDAETEDEDVQKELNEMVAWLKSLRPQPKEEREPMEIKYGGKIYQVHGMRALPGGASGYIIEDEPGHYDCIMNPEEVLGGGYGVKQNGSPYPTKEATFDHPHWKPSEEQMEALCYVKQFDYGGHKAALESLYNDLKKLM